LIEGEEKHYPAILVTAVDTVAAGDASNGAVAAVRISQTTKRFDGDLLVVLWQSLKKVPNQPRLIETYY
jgi:sugar/nucleoside kinase (ribokinase family)